MPSRIFIIFFCILGCGPKTSFHGLASKIPDTITEHERFVLRDSRAMVDILIVADSSQSMYHHLNSLGKSLSSLLSVIKEYNWQIGFISADHGDHDPTVELQDNWKNHVHAKNGRFGNFMFLDQKNSVLQKFLTAQTPNYENVFLQTLSHDDKKIDCNKAPHCTFRTEQPLRSLQSAIKRSVLNNKAFFRPEADLITLIITNEEERSEDPTRATSAQDVMDTFYQMFGNNKRFLAFNFFVTDDICLETESQQGSVASVSKSLFKLAELTGGSNVSICSTNYNKELKTISQYIKNSLESFIVLKNKPIPSSLKIQFDDTELEWELQDSQILFQRADTVSREITGSIFYQNQD